MKKKLLVLIPAIAMLLAGCGETTSSKTSSAPIGSSVSSIVDSGSQSGASQGSQSGASSVKETVESVQISDAAITLDIGGSKQLSAIAKPSTLSDKDVIWSSSAEGVAKVSTGGMVTAIAAGTAKIKAAAKLDQTKYAECTVTVNKQTVLAYAYEPVIGTEYRLGTFQENAAVNKMIYVDKNDLESQRFNSVANFADGAVFKFEAGSTQGKYHLTRINKSGTKEYVNIAGGTPSATADYHWAVGATATTDWDWDSDYFTIKCQTTQGYSLPATYNAYTTISMCALSQADADYVARFYVQAEPATATKVEIVPNANVEVYAGASVQLKARISPMGAQNSQITWSSDNAKVTVANGKVTAAADATGTAKITAKVSESVKAEVTVTIKEKLNYGTAEAPLTVQQAIELIDKVGTTTEQEVYVTGRVTSSSYNTTYKNFEIWLNNGDVAKGYELYATVLDASITADYTAKDALYGKVVVCRGFAKKYNTTYEHTNIKVGDDYVYPTVLSVKDGAYVAPTSVKLNKETATVDAGKTLQLSATLLPLFATGTVAWSVEGNNKVTVDQNGLVTVAADAVGGSTATVKAKVGQLAGQCLVTVAAAAQGQTETYTITAASLLGYDGLDDGSYDASKNIAYVTEATQKTDASGLKFEILQVGAYGSGIQMKKNAGAYIKTAEALSGAITKIEVNVFSGKTLNATIKTAKTVDGLATATAPASAASYEFSAADGVKVFQIETASTTEYIKSIVVTAAKAKQTVDPVTVTAASLLGYDGLDDGSYDASKNIAYVTTATEKTDASGLKFEIVQVGAYGSGIQMKKNAGAYIKTAEATAANIVKIEVNVFSGKTLNATVKTAKTVDGLATATAPASAASYEFSSADGIKAFQIETASTTEYIKSIVITFA